MGFVLRLPNPDAFPSRREKTAPMVTTLQRPSARAPSRQQQGVPMQSPLHSEPPQHTEPTMQEDGQLDSQVPFAQVMSPEPKGSGPHTSPGAHGQPAVPSGHVFTISHQVPYEVDETTYSLHSQPTPIGSSRKNSTQSSGVLQDSG